jgi:hypothetical protein
MTTTTKKPFSTRAFVAIVAATSGIGLPVTGLMNHAHQVEPPFILARHAWMSAHTSLGVIFTVFAVWHVILNRRALLSHVRGIVARVPGLTREALVAVALVVALVGIVVSHAFHG